MKILFVTPYYYPEVKFGGPPKRLHALSRGLVAKGYEVSALTFDSERRSRCDLTAIDDVSVQYVPWVGNFRWALPEGFRRIRNEIRNADIVHCYGLYNLLGPLAVQYAARYGIPFCLEPMGMFVPRGRSFLLKSLYNATFTKWMAKRASAVVATSEIEADELKTLGFDVKIIVRRNGIDPTEFQRLPDRSIMRSRWNVALEEQLVVYIGRISAKKNLRELTRAFVTADIRSSKLVIAGPVSEPEYLRQLIRDVEAIGRRGDIRIAEALYDQDLKAAFAAADLFVLPSLNENFGNAAGEAVAAGVPVLLTDTCGIAPLIHQRAGLAVPLGLHHLTEGLRLMMRSEIRDQMTARREEVKRELSWEGPITQTIELYEQILKQSSAS